MKTNFNLRLCLLRTFLSRNFLIVSEKFFQRGQTGFEQANCALHISEPAERGGRAQPVAVIKGWDAGNHLARLDIVAGRALGRQDCVVANSQMASDACLSRQDYAPPDVRASGKTNLSANKRYYC